MKKVRKKIRVLAIGHDVGGAQVLREVVKALKKDGQQVDLIIGRMAQKIFARNRPQIVDEPWSTEQIARYFKQHRPDLLLTSTSWKSELEQGFRNQARHLAIPSVVLMDFWSNYRMRWQHANYRFEEGYDHVCVMDAPMARTMQKEGYPRQKLHIIGHPHLEQCSRAIKVKGRSKAGISSVDRVLLLSIPLAALGMQETPLAPIKIVCDGLAQWRRHTQRKIVLSIRQHPHEKRDPNFLIEARKLAAPGITIQLADNTKPVKNNIRTHDYIMGYVTMVLFETRAFGKQAIAMEITPYATDLKEALKTSGIQLVRFTPQKIAACLRTHSLRAKPPLPPSHRGSAAAVTSLCRTLVR